MFLLKFMEVVQWMKKKIKRLNNLEKLIPQEAFIGVLKINKET